MGFPEQLKAARRNLNYTQQQVAEFMGITNSAYCGYETGKRQPDIAKIRQLVGILQISGDTLLETGYCPESDKKLQELLSVFHSLRPEFQDFALEHLRKLAELQERT